VLWRIKRKDMRDALATTEYPRKGEVHLMDYKLSSRVRSKDRTLTTSEAYGVRLFLKTE
jgi:hypothetical protein